MKYYNLGPETEQVEYKKTTSELKEGVISIADILNKLGKGTLYFGGKLERDEIPEVPVDAIREAVINAFAHRRIESGQAVDIAVDRSYIEVYSPGPFPEGVTPEMFIKESRRPIRRNPLITRTLYYSKDMESFATGLRRIQNFCDEAGVQVEYINDIYGFTVRFYRHCGEGWTELAASDETQNESQTQTQNDPQTVSGPQNGPNLDLKMALKTSPAGKGESLQLRAKS